jgi:hypothetical protein
LIYINNMEDFFPLSHNQLTVYKNKKKIHPLALSNYPNKPLKIHPFLCIWEKKGHWGTPVYVLAGAVYKLDTAPPCPERRVAVLPDQVAESQ